MSTSTPTGNDPEAALFHDCVETLEEVGGGMDDAAMSPTQYSAGSFSNGSRKGRQEAFTQQQRIDEESGPLLVVAADNDNNERNNCSGDNDTRAVSQTLPVQGHHNDSPQGASTNNSDIGSSVPAAIFNFTNSIIGAGCIGLGGAIAMSGGFISIALIIFFALLTKASLDLVIRLSVERQQQQQQQQSGGVAATTVGVSYEDLAQAGLGRIGRLIVLACKFSYSFGCLVAYVIVIKDNCGPALKSLIYGHEKMIMSASSSSSSTAAATAEVINHWFYVLLSENAWFTWSVSSGLILPLCMLRDMTPLASASLVSVVSMVMIVTIVIYIYFACPHVRQPGGSFYEKWIEIRPGVLGNLGTFVFTFVSQHTVHLVYSSLKPRLRTVSNWKIVSTCSIFSSAVVSLLIGVFVYMTFWEQTQSDIFLIYPQSWMINTAKLLLCVTMIFTFPLPFFTCRELVIVTLIHPFCGIDWCRDDDNNNDNGENIHPDTVEIAASDYYDGNNALEHPLLLESNDTSMIATQSDASSLATDLSRRVLESATPKNWLLPDDDRQLQLPGHISLTFKLWLVITALAIASPSLGDILDLVGCASGTLIAFIIPALLSFRLEGYNNLALLIFVVGGVVGTVGTYYSVKQLVKDIRG